MLSFRPHLKQIKRPQFTPLKFGLEKLKDPETVVSFQAEIGDSLHHSSSTMVTVTSMRLVCFVGCLTSQQHARVSQGRICSDNCKSCHTEIEVADQTFYLSQSQYTDTWPTSPSTDPIMPGAWQGSNRSANF